MYLSRLSISQVNSLHAPSLVFLGRQLSSQEGCRPHGKDAGLTGRLQTSCQCCDLCGRLAAFPQGLQHCWETCSQIYKIVGQNRPVFKFINSLLKQRQILYQIYLFLEHRIYKVHEIYKVHIFMLKYKKLNKQLNELISLDKAQTAWHQSA